MTLLLAFFIYLLVWWVMLFAVLPFGIRRHQEEGKGFDAGAPENPNLKKKIIITSILSALIVLTMHILVETGVIDWVGMFDKAWV